MTHAFVITTHPDAFGKVWTWQCSCGTRLRAEFFGVHVSWLPDADAWASLAAHLAFVDAEIDPAFLER